MGNWFVSGGTLIHRNIAVRILNSTSAPPLGSLRIKLYQLPLAPETRRRHSKAWHLFWGCQLCGKPVRQGGGYLLPSETSAACAVCLHTPGAERERSAAGLDGKAARESLALRTSRQWHLGRCAAASTLRAEWEQSGDHGWGQAGGKRNATWTVGRSWEDMGICDALGKSPSLFQSLPQPSCCCSGRLAA